MLRFAVIFGKHTTGPWLLLRPESHLALKIVIIPTVPAHVLGRRVPLGICTWIYTKFLRNLFGLQEFRKPLDHLRSLYGKKSQLETYCQV